MVKKVLNQSISLKEYISKKEYIEINQLEDKCSSKDKTNLKLELNYKLNMCNHSEIVLKNINEFFYYVDEVLVAYLGISSFGSNIGEINGMTHPDWRRKGLFKKLFELAMVECQKRNFNKILLLADDKSNSGVEFIKSIGGKYDFSEYRMKLTNKVSSEYINLISLRKAGNFDGKKIRKLNAMFSNCVEESETFEAEDEIFNENTYMVELKGEIIGKISVEYSDNSAFIFGFGILPDFRSKGYGKATLNEVLRLINEGNIRKIELDVECNNDTALNLYKACGFEEKSVMNYYSY